MEENIQKLFDLIETGDQNNIALAFKIAEGQNIDLEKITRQEYGELCDFVHKIKKRKKMSIRLYHTFQKINKMGTEWRISINRKELSIPDKLADFPEITLLSLSQSRRGFFVLSKAISKLPKLKELNISTGVVEIPNWIDQLQTLETLSFCNTQITELPKELFLLKNLKHLFLQKTQITEISPEIGNLTSLETLDISYTKVQKLPKEIGNLVNLNELCLNQLHELKELPVEIGNLSNLETLFAKSCSLQKLPNSMQNMTNLSFLYLSYNKLETIEGWIGNLKNLSTLYLDHMRTNFTFLPKEMGELESLEYMTIRGTKITEIPIEMRKLKNLNQFNLQYETENIF